MNYLKFIELMDAEQAAKIVDKMEKTKREARKLEAAKAFLASLEIKDSQ